MNRAAPNLASPVCACEMVRPNPPLEPNRYGRQRKPGLRYSVNCLSPGSSRLPTRAAQLGRWASRMRLRDYLNCFALLGFALSAHAQGSVEVVLKPTKPQAPPPYEAISFVSEGPTYGNTDEAVRGRYQRVLVVAGVLAYDHPTIRLETLTYGDEGCCRRIVGAWDLRLSEVSDRGISLPKAENADITFTRWLGAHSFAFSYGALRCKVTRVGQAKVTISCSH